MNWPYPEDDRLARRTRVAKWYRERLADINPVACAELDEVMTALGQAWIYDGAVHHDDHDLLTLEEAAEWADVARNTVQKWIARGHLERRVNADRKVSVLMADLIDFQQRRTS